MKYGNRKVSVDGYKFDSVREAQRYIDLSLMQRAGVISDLRRQVPFELVPKQKDSRGRVIREIRYIADFVYTENGKTVVEDAKGYKTKEYELKKKLMKYFHNIEIKET
jgi:hypothetical protein